MKKRLIKNILSLIVLIVILFTTYEIFKLNVLPNKYLILFIVGETILYLLGLLFYNLKKKALIVIGIILFIISITGNAFGYYFLNKTNTYIDKSLGTNTYSIETKYYVIANKDSTVNNIKELKESDTIEYYKYSRSIEKALKKLGNYNYISSDAASKSMENVTNNNSYFLIASVNYDYLMESTNLYSRDNYKIIGEFNVMFLLII